MQRVTCNDKMKAFLKVNLFFRKKMTSPVCGIPYGFNNDSNLYHYYLFLIKIEKKIFLVIVIIYYLGVELSSFLLPLSVQDEKSN